MADHLPTTRPVSAPVSYRVGKELRAILGATRTEETAIQAVEHVTMAGMHSAFRVRQLQQQLELMLPSSADVLNLIAMNGCMSVAAAVQKFGQRVT